MSVFVIADIKVTDGSWVPGYAAMVHDIVHRHGGRYLARSGNIETLEGPPPEADLIALIEFPSKDAAKAFATDPVYAPFAAARQPARRAALARTSEDREHCPLPRD